MLASLRADMLAVLDRPAATLHQQVHPELSPLAWHVGHALQVERHWLCERLLGEPVDEVARAIYFPEYTHKAARATQLPPLATLRRSLSTLADELDLAWQRVPTHHGAISSGYLQAFVTQHYAQHLETVAMADHAQRITGGIGIRSVWMSDAATPAEDRWCQLDATRVTLGRLQDCETPAPYDNELGAHEVDVPAQHIAAKPVTVRQWIGFMQDDGYTTQDLWGAEGWQWRRRHSVTAPWGWRAEHGAITICPAWPAAAGLDAPVVGISHHEAAAYAKWAGAKLPHEAVWLAARQANLLDNVGIVWEWCSNALTTFPGFVAFPYARYTTPWCDGRHWVLKGGSAMTRAPIRRAHFRNFYTPEQRHIFAGVRLCEP